MDTLVSIFQVNLLGYAHWFMSIRITQMRDNYISVDQARYDNSIVDKYLDTYKFKVSVKLYNTTLTYNIVFTKANISTSDEQVEIFTRQYNINYIACIVSLIYLLSTTLYLSFAVNKLAKFSSNSGTLHFEGLVIVFI